jgi:hypothetical protein
MGGALVRQDGLVRWAPTGVLWPPFPVMELPPELTRYNMKKQKDEVLRCQSSERNVYLLLLKYFTVANALDTIAR